MIFCSFLFAGCGIMKTTEIYKFNAIRYINDDNTITIEVNGKFNGVEIKEDNFVLILNPDKTFALRCNLDLTNHSNTVLNSFKEVAVGTWMDGYDNEIYFAVHEESDVFIGIKGTDNIVFDLGNDIQMCLKK